jgi:uncharacterized membrane protein YedE/YeeE
MNLTVAWMSLGGGALIGTAASVLLLANGRIAGISGILGGAISFPRGDTGWRIAFLAGLVAGAIGFYLYDPSFFANTLQRSPGAVVLAGLLVGVGTALGSGCTSGHGVCGLSRFSVRSLVAVMTFMFTGFVMATLISRFLGGGA